MMKFLLFIMVLFLSVSANLIKQEELYNKGECEASIAEAKNSLEDVSDLRYHLLWARCAQKLGDENDAMSAYERVLMFDENNVEAKVALVNIYRYTDREDLAKEMIQELDGVELSKEQKKSLYRSAHRSIYSLRTTLMLSSGEDSNLNSAPTQADLNDYLDTNSSSGELSSSFYRVFLNVDYKNELGTKGGWYSQVKYNYYNQTNQEDALYDITLNTIELALGHKGAQYSYVLPVSLSTIHYLNKSLLNQQKIEPKLTMTLKKKYMLNLSALYTQHRYIQSEDYSRDDNVLGFKTSLYYIISKGFYYATFAYTDVSAQSSNPSVFVDKTNTTLSLGVKYFVYKNLALKGSMKYKDVAYSDAITTAVEPSTAKRSDTYTQYDVKLSYAMMKHLEFFVSQRYAKNSSNYVPAEYSKSITQLGMNLSY